MALPALLVPAATGDEADLMGTYGEIGNRRTLVRASLTQDGRGDWDVRIRYLDDDTEDRGNGFASRALAQGWAEAKIYRHFSFGVPGRLS